MSNHTSKTTPFLSGHARAQGVTYLLVAGIGLDVVAIVSVLAQIEPLVQVTGAMQGLLWLSTGVLFLMWLHRAYCNLPALGVHQLQYSPGWAIGGFFVPVLSLVRPFQVMRELWHASDPTWSEDSVGPGPKTPPLLGWWWVLFLMANMVSSFVGWGQFAPEVLSAIAALLAVLVVQEIDRRQADKYTHRTPPQTPTTLRTVGSMATVGQP